MFLDKFWEITTLHYIILGAKINCFLFIHREDLNLVLEEVFLQHVII